jgi:hypothetical protein
MNYKKIITACLILCTILGILTLCLPYKCITLNGVISNHSFLTDALDGDIFYPGFLIEFLVVCLNFALPIVVLTNKKYYTKFWVWGLLLLSTVVAYLILDSFYFWSSLSAGKSYSHYEIKPGPALDLPIVEGILLVLTILLLVIERKRKTINA